MDVSGLAVATAASPLAPTVLLAPKAAPPPLHIGNYDKCTPHPCCCPPPSIHGDMVLAGALNGTAVGFDIAAGRRKWAMRTGHGVRCGGRRSAGVEWRTGLRSPVAQTQDRLAATYGDRMVLLCEGPDL
jgi:hypothetical protein